MIALLSLLLCATASAQTDETNPKDCLITNENGTLLIENCNIYSTSDVTISNANDVVPSSDLLGPGTKEIKPDLTNADDTRDVITFLRVRIELRQELMDAEEMVLTFADLCAVDRGQYVTSLNQGGHKAEKVEKDARDHGEHYQAELRRWRNAYINMGALKSRLARLGLYTLLPEDVDYTPPHVDRIWSSTRTGVTFPNAFDNCP